ncbi:iron-sulfur cluster assembly scaffold protein, partial [Aeromonas salmonicida]|uniref:iron-sulfur cluster assembly scaffold protein n=1 Tax=Aeromonas salmonicida TaxID=645 RepID=UPI000A88CD00
MAYSEKVIDHYENPRNVGGFDKNDPNIATGMVGAPACGDVMKLQLKISDDGIIEDAKFKTYGCGSAIASSSLVTEWVKGKTLVSLMLIEDETGARELFARKRLTFDALAEVVARDDVRWSQAIAALEGRFGEIVKGLSNLKDFVLFRLKPEQGLFVKGF